MVREFFITKIYNKRKLLEEKTKDIECSKSTHINLSLNKYNASLLVCTLAFVCRYIYYGRVENVEIQDFYNSDDFGEIFYQLRMTLLCLNEKCKHNFEDYNEFKICK